jgi:hypothetical protein
MTSRTKGQLWTGGGPRASELPIGCPFDRNDDQHLHHHTRRLLEVIPSVRRGSWVMARPVFDVILTMILVQ